MFPRKTVFVIGAGCSVDYGFPLGNDLRRRIFEKVYNEDEVVVRALLSSGAPEANVNVQRRCRNFASGIFTHETIDQYLDFLKDDPADLMLGKIAIAACILEAEKASPLRSDRLTGGLATVSESWAVLLYNRIVSNIGARNLENATENLTFVCFNYDRCIEQVFSEASRLLTRDGERASLMTRRLNVLHPYGSLGPIGAQLIAEERQHGLDFGLEGAHYPQVLAASRQIKTYTEPAATHIQSAIGREMDQAEQVVFLGFGFIPWNMRIINRRSHVPLDKVYFNTYKMPEPVRQIALEDARAALVRDTTQPTAWVKSDLSASEFLQHYGLALFRRP